MPGYFAAYAEAIRAHPDADIFSGGFSSETSASGISWANFYYGYYELWPPLKFVPGFVSMANFAVRRGILVGADLDRDGALEFLALPRLAARITHCPDAVVDHVENWRWFDYLRGHFHNGRASIAVVHALRPESIAGRGLRVVRHCVNVVCLRPLRVVGGLRRVIARRWLLFPALVLLGLSHAIGILVGSMLGAGNSKFDIHGLSND